MNGIKEKALKTYKNETPKTKTSRSIYGIKNSMT